MNLSSSFSGLVSSYLRYVIPPWACHTVITPQYYVQVHRHAHIIPWILTAVCIIRTVHVSIVSGQHLSSPGGHLNSQHSAVRACITYTYVQYTCVNNEVYNEVERLVNYMFYQQPHYTHCIFCIVKQANRVKQTHTLAYPKLKLMALAWPMWRMPLGSGGNLVTTCYEELHNTQLVHIIIQGFDLSPCLLQVFLEKPHSVRGHHIAFGLIVLSCYVCIRKTQCMYRDNSRRACPPLVL